MVTNDDVHCIRPHCSNYREHFFPTGTTVQHPADYIDCNVTEVERYNPRGQNRDPDCAGAWKPGKTGASFCAHCTYVIGQTLSVHDECIATDVLHARAHEPDRSEVGRDG